jgi:N-acetylornithine carbamoyltransferase
VVLQPGKDAWPIEFIPGAVMDGEAEEHVIEAAGVLSRYVDLIAVRAFPKFIDWQQDRRDIVINAFAAHATVPVINMETITHPCQELAHIMALQEKLGDLAGRKYLLTWTWHPRPLNTAVANSAAMIATRFGMDVTLLCPNEQYLLDDRYLNVAAANAEASGASGASGGSFTISHDIDEAYDGAEIVYAKSWGALLTAKDDEEGAAIAGHHTDWITDERRMALAADGAIFMHPLPADRNVEVANAVIDGPQSVVYDEAENRLHVQKAVMALTMG